MGMKRRPAIATSPVDLTEFAFDYPEGAVGLGYLPGELCLTCARVRAAAGVEHATAATSPARISPGDGDL